jgi:hypothetical protein
MKRIAQAVYTHVVKEIQGEDSLFIELPTIMYCTTDSVNDTKHNPSTFVPGESKSNSRAVLS